MNEEPLVPVIKYSNKIRELPITKRISLDYPLLCRDTVAKKLTYIAEKLPSGLHLQVDSAYRSKKTEQILWNSRKGIIPGLVINPNEGRSSHNTGGAVDVSLTNSGGEEINLSDPFPKYYNEPFLISDKINPKAQELRLVLNKLMLEQGFVAHPKEYWHFSYGDNRWSEQTKNPALYGGLELGKARYFCTLTILYYKVLKKIERLVNKIFNVETNI